ncbi:MAG: hypothetical protein AAGH64_10780, partial [Planctomycetota bacterium]
MTTAHLALFARTVAAFTGAVTVVLLLTGCAVLASGERFDDPRIVVAPYEAGRDVVVAVAPLRNESGASSVDELS